MSVSVRLSAISMRIVERRGLRWAVWSRPRREARVRRKGVGAVLGRASGRMNGVPSKFLLKKNPSVSERSVR